VASSAAKVVEETAVENSIAAAAAIAPLDILLICMLQSSLVTLQRYCCSLQKTRVAGSLLLKNRS
jgi:hypothetical protein